MIWKCSIIEVTFSESDTHRCREDVYVRQRRAEEYFSIPMVSFKMSGTSDPICMKESVSNLKRLTLITIRKISRLDKWSGGDNVLPVHVRVNWKISLMHTERKSLIYNIQYKLKAIIKAPEGLKGLARTEDEWNEHHSRLAVCFLHLSAINEAGLRQLSKLHEESQVGSEDSEQSVPKLLEHHLETAKCLTCQRETVKSRPCEPKTNGLHRKAHMLKCVKEELQCKVPDVLFSVCLIRCVQGFHTGWTQRPAKSLLHETSISNKRPFGCVAPSVTRLFQWRNDQEDNEMRPSGRAHCWQTALEGRHGTGLGHLCLLVTSEPNQRR